MAALIQYSGGMMFRKIQIAMTAICILLLYSISQSNPYKVGFSFESPGNPREINIRPEFAPGIHVSVDFGPFMNACDWPLGCWPPPELFAVRVTWKSPTPGSCYIPVYEAVIYGEYYYQLMGHAHWGIEPKGPPHCCQWSPIIGQG